MQDIFQPLEEKENFPTFFHEPHQSIYIAFRQLCNEDQVTRVAEILSKPKLIGLQQNWTPETNWTDEDKVILIGLYRTSQDALQRAFKAAEISVKIRMGEKLAFDKGTFVGWVIKLNQEGQFARPRNASSDHTKVALIPDAFLRLSRKPSPQNPSVNSSSESGRTTTTCHFNLRPCLTGTANFFWKNRNAGQRTGEILFATAGLSAILGAVSAQSTTLTAVGAAAAKFLPSFVASFGLTHAIPPAALAFYAIAGALAAAALVLLIASTVHQCSHKPKNDHFVFADWDTRPPTYH